MYSNGTLSSRRGGGGGGALLHPVSADMAISNFHIQYDRGVAQFRPGEQLKGKVVMDVWTPVHILLVEFKIEGFCTVRHFKDASFAGKAFQEYYISKRIALLSPPAGASTLHLKRGKYMSDFSYTLPHDIPPTVRQFDLGHGYVFDISYVARAQVCDIARATTGAGGAQQVARVVKATKATFAVSPVVTSSGEDRNDEAITHAEQIQLFCSPFSTPPTSVLVQLNRGAFTVGEYVKVHIELLTPAKKRVRRLVAELEQSVRLQLGKKTVRFRQTLIKAVDDGRGRKLVPKAQEMPYGGVSDLDMIKTGFRLPLPPNFVPSHLPGCRILDTSYCVKVSVKFGRLGGELIERIPIAVHPVQTEHDNALAAAAGSSNKIPLFNKPIMQFPYFAKNPLRDSIRSSDSRAAPSVSTDFGGSQQRAAKYDRVTTQYKTCLTCCGCCLLCLGYGIYD